MLIVTAAAVMERQIIAENGINRPNSITSNVKMLYKNNTSSKQQWVNADSGKALSY